MIKKINVTAGNWIHFRVYRGKDEIPGGVVKYHQTNADLECTCKAYKQGNPCSHIEWLSKEFTYDKTFEDIRALIMKEAGVDYSYTVIEDLWDKCLKVTNVRLYESLKQGTKTSKNPLNFKLEREGTFGVDTSSKPDQTALGWQGTVSGSDQQWRVEQWEKNVFSVRMISMTNEERPWRTVERIGPNEWKSNCACRSDRACIHEMAARTAYAAWLGDGLIDKKTTDETRGAYMTVKGLSDLKDFQKKLLDSIQIEIKNNLFGGNTETITATNSTSGMKEEWKYMGPTAWGTKVFVSPYVQEERQEIEQPVELIQKPEEPTPPAKPKNRFSEMEL